MIRIGLNNIEKEKIIIEYIGNNNIKKCYIFYFEKFKYEYNLDCEVEYIEYKDIEMYKYFYRLIEEIDNNSLLIFNECMRTQNRSELIYNCAHHYCNQTNHKIIFEYFPFIDDIQNFMILLDFIDKSKYKNKSFAYWMLNDIDIKYKNIIPKLEIVNIEITNKQINQYEEKKKSLFDNLGKKHPDTIPSNLALFSNNFKKKYIESNKKYIARNARFNLDNVYTYDNAVDNNLIILDYPIRQIYLNDYIKRTNTNKLIYISTGLKIDLYYINELKKLMDDWSEFIAKASI